MGSDLSYPPAVPELLAIAGIPGFPATSSEQLTREGAASLGDNFQ